MPLRSKLVRLPLVGPALFDLVRRLRYPAVERAIRADLLETWQRMAWLRDAADAKPSAPKTLLVLSLSDNVYQLKLEAMLASALRLEGWHILILTDSPANSRSRRYFAAFGLDEFIYLDDFPATAAERTHCDSASRSLISTATSFQAVKEWNFEGSWIGPQVLSTISRQAHEGAPDPADPEIKRAIASLLPDLLERVVVARRVVQQAQPDLAMVIEANYATYGPFVDQVIAHGAAVIQVTQPWRDDALTLRRLTAETRRMHPSSVASETLDSLTHRPWTPGLQDILDAMFADRYGGKWHLQARNQPETRPVERDDLIKRAGLVPEKKIAVVFSHVLWDANLFYGEDLFEDYGEWFVETVRGAVANPSLNWLIKMHPANLWKRAREGVAGEYSEVRLIREKIGDLPAHVILLKPDSDINSLSLFSNTDFCITVRGTSGMEMPCFGKPTLTAGTGRYSGLGFTIDSESREQYLARLAELHLLEPMAEEKIIRAKWHAYAAFNLRPWCMTSFRSEFNTGDNRGGALEHNLVCTIDSRKAADANGDLSRFASWAAGDAIDYLEAFGDSEQWVSEPLAVGSEIVR
jgi:hypothetical protein